LGAGQAGAAPAGSGKNSNRRQTASLRICSEYHGAAGQKQTLQKPNFGQEGDFLPGRNRRNSY